MIYQPNQRQNQNMEQIPALKPNCFLFFANGSLGNIASNYLERDSILSFTKRIGKFDKIYVDSILMDAYTFSVQTKGGYYDILIEGADRFRHLSDRFQVFWENYSPDAFEVPFHLNPDLFK